MDMKSMIKPLIAAYGEDKINEAISSLTETIKDQESADCKIRFLVELHNQPKKDTPVVTKLISTRNTDTQKWERTKCPEYNQKPLLDIFQENEDNITSEIKFVLRTVFPMVAKAFKNKDGGYIKISIYNKEQEIEGKEVLQTIMQVNTYDSEDCNTAIDEYTFSQFLEMILGK